jgi:hypothetical protein
MSVDHFERRGLLPNESQMTGDQIGIATGRFGPVEIGTLGDGVGWEIFALQRISLQPPGGWKLVQD